MALFLLCVGASILRSTGKLNPLSYLLQHCLSQLILFNYLHQNIIISQNKQSINFMIQIYHHVCQRLWSRFFFRKIVNVYSEGSENKSFFDEDASATKATGTFKREIIVPYGRLKRERFYDWPPLPKVSTAKASKANTISSRFPLSANKPKLITLTKCRYRYSDK